MIKLGTFRAHCAEIIRNNINGRKLVCYGDIDKEFENYLSDQYGIKIAFMFLRTEKLCDGVTVFPFSEVDNKSDEYYIISFTNADISSKTGFLEESGYKPVVDYYFMGNPGNKVRTGQIYYFDGNGNTCNYCPENCEIIFNGHNSEVIIPTDIKIRRRLRIEVGDNSKVEFSGRTNIVECEILCLGDFAQITFGEQVLIRKGDFFVHYNSKVHIGKGTSCNEGLHLRAFSNCNINIGSDCMFSQEIKVLAGDGHAIFDTASGERTNASFDDENPEKYTISIRDHVWVGRGTTILNPSDIGKGSIIAAGALVKGKFPNNCTIGGVPAKILRKNAAWSRNFWERDISGCGEGFYGLTDEDDSV